MNKPPPEASVKCIRYCRLSLNSQQRPAVDVPVGILSGNYVHIRFTLVYRRVYNVLSTYAIDDFRLNLSPAIDTPHALQVGW